MTEAGERSAEGLTPAVAGDSPSAANPATATVVVVSRHRPQALALCLQALILQDHPAFEVVLVTDPQSLRVRPDLPIRRVAFDEPNISAARNAGIAAAGGTWSLSSTTTRWRNRPGCHGWSRRFPIAACWPPPGSRAGATALRWQCRGERIGRDGLAVATPIPGTGTALHWADATGPISTLGTNCAFRRAALIELGGFDPAFAYFLDESDLNWRLALRWPTALTAVVPGAEVVHGWAGDTRRHKGGVPVDLWMVGRSLAQFCARYGGDPAAATAAQRRRLVQLVVAGRLDPLRVRPLLAGLRGGMDKADLSGPPAPLRLRPPAFTPLSGTGPRRAVTLGGWHWQAADLRARARNASGRGCIVTVLLLSPTTLRHRARFTEGGWWEQAGGVWGPSVSGDGTFWMGTSALRIARESARIAAVREPPRHEPAPAQVFPTQSRGACSGTRD